MKLNKALVLNKSRTLSAMLIILLLLFSFIIVLSDKSTYSSDTDNVSSVSLSCPDSVMIGENLNCDVYLTSSSTVITLAAVYGLPNNFSFIKGVSKGWNQSFFEKTAFVMLHNTGVKGTEQKVATLSFKVPLNTQLDKDYEVSLTNIVINTAEESNKDINLDNATTTIRVVDNPNVDVNANTLDGINLSDGILNEEFVSEKFGYTATVDSDTVNITAVKTVETATVTGTGVVALHYGTNDVNIDVTSADGSSKNTYNIKIFRPYNFSSTNYVYNSENNYIYTKNDSEEIILSNVTLDSPLKKKIDNNKLIISYENEDILSINILSIDLSKYILNDKDIYLSEEVSYSDFISNISVSSGIELKVYKDSNVVSSGNIASSMNLQVYYGNDKIDSYNIRMNELKFDSSVTVDEDNKYIKYIDPETTVSQFMSKISSFGYNIYVHNKNGAKKENNEQIFTGDVLKIYLNNNVVLEYQLSILGDSSGDGELSLLDLAQFRKNYVGLVLVNGIYKESFDFNKDGKISLIDLAIMRKTYSESDLNG